MAAEERNGGGAPSENPTKVDHSFDDLARAVAEGSLSRRGALKLIAGTALAALIPSRALADDDECVRVCHVPFDRETEECDFANAVTRCVSRRERRRHLENHPCDCRGRCANCLEECTEHIICDVALPFCGPGIEDCFCAKSVEGTLICGADPCGPECTSDAECDAIVPGSICQIPEGGCCGQTCIFPCGAAPLTVSSPSTNSGG